MAVDRDGDTFEDGLVISESAAARMDFPAAVGVGDRMSNRHGAKAVVTRILDADMPQLPDGTPIELIFVPPVWSRMVSRLNFGQQREAVMGRLAQAAGCPAPPFQAPSEEMLKARLVEAGLPEDGMEQLLKGAKLPYRSTVGWVYWGLLAAHTAAERLETAVTGVGGPELDMMAYGALCEAGAVANIHALFNTAAAERPDANALGQRLTTGPVPPAPPPHRAWRCCSSCWVWPGYPNWRARSCAFPLPSRRG